MNIYLSCRLRTEVQASGLSTNYNNIIILFAQLQELSTLPWANREGAGNSK